MSKPSRIRTPLILLATFGTVLALSAGCSKQGEGERCSNAANGNEDCDDGLVCTLSTSLGPTSGGVDRCCPPAPPIGDERCLPSVGNPGSGGSSSSGGSSGSGGGGTSSGGGASEGGSSEGGVTSTGGVSSSGGDTSSTGGVSSSGGDTSSTGGVSGGAGGA